MNRDRRTALAVGAEWLLRHLIQFWPQESREWGMAMTAEASEIEGSWEALRWSLGGAAFFLRSIVSHLLAWIRLPAGVGLHKSSNSTPPLVPKHSRLLTATFFCGAALVLGLPQGREAITAVRASWSPTDVADSDKRAIEDLAARAIREKDAKALAFAAMCYREKVSSEKWAEQAVAMDARLSWIYAIHVTSGTSKMWWEIPGSHLETLREFDPDNSFVYLLSADQLFRTKTYPLYHNGSPSQQQINQLLADDPEWVMWMDRAMQAPSYDNYEQKRYELQRQVWSEHRNLSPEVIVHAIQSHAFPDISNLTALAAIRIQQAKHSRQSGDNAAAEQSLKDLIASSDRLTVARQKDLILLTLQTVRRKCLAELGDLYTSTGRNQDAAAIAARVAQLEPIQNPRTTSRGPNSASYIAPFPWKAYCVQLSALALVLFLLVSTLSLGVLEITGVFPYKLSGAWRRFSCFAADYAPLILLFASGSLLLSYRPFADVFGAFRSGELPLQNQWTLLSTLYSLRFASPAQLIFGDTYRLWWAVTVILTCLAVFILVRPLLRRRLAA